MKKYLMVLVLMVANTSSANSQFSVTNIEKFIIHDSGQEIILVLDKNVNNNESCPINNQIVLLRSHISFNELYAALLSAFYSGTNFNGWVNGCQRDRPILTRLDLIK